MNAKECLSKPRIMSIFKTRCEISRLTRTAKAYPVNSRPLSQFVDYDPENGSVLFADGSKEQADLVVAADGIRSNALGQVLRSDIAAKPTNTTVIRFMLRTADMLVDPITAPLLAAGKGWTT